MFFEIRLDNFKTEYCKTIAHRFSYKKRNNNKPDNNMYCNNVWNTKKTTLYNIIEKRTDQKKRLDVIELRDGEVCSERGLSTFLPYDTDADAGGLDHWHVVTTVTCRWKTNIKNFANQLEIFFRETLNTLMITLITEFT